MSTQEDDLTDDTAFVLTDKAGNEYTPKGNTGFWPYSHGGLSYFVTDVWILPETSELDDNFWMGPEDTPAGPGQGFLCMWEIYKINFGIVLAGTALPNSWKFFDDIKELKPGKNIYFPAATVDTAAAAADAALAAEPPLVEPQTGPVTDKVIPSVEPADQLSDATHYIYHPWADLSKEERSSSPEIEQVNHIFPFGPGIESLEGAMPVDGILPFVNDPSFPAEDIKKTSEGHTVSDFPFPAHLLPSTRANYLIPWKSQVVIKSRRVVDGAVFCEIAPPIPGGQGISTIGTTHAGVELDWYTNYLSDGDRSYWINENLLVRFGTVPASLAIAPPPIGPYTPQGEPSFQATSGDDWANAFEEEIPQFIDYDPMTGIAGDYHYVIKVNIDYDAKEKDPEPLKQSLLADSLERASMVGAARLLKYYGKELRPDPHLTTKAYLESMAISSGLAAMDTAGLPFFSAKYKISGRAIKKRLAVLVAFPQVYFEALENANLNLWMGRELALVKTEHEEEEWYSLGIPITKKVSDTLTIDYYRSHDLKDAMEQVADILDRFHGPVESFKHGGGDVRTLNCSQEASRLRDAIPHIQKFLRMRGQGGKYVSFEDDSAAPDSTKILKRRPADFGESRLEIGLDTALNLVYFTFESQSDSGLVPYIVGLDYLKQKISPRTFALMLYAENIIEYMETRSGPAGFKNDSGQTYSAAQAGPDGPPSLTISGFDTLEEIDGQSASTDEWIDFVSKFIFPIVAIRPSKNKKDPKYDDCVKKMQQLDRLSVKTEEQFLLEERMLADSDCKRIILEERRATQELIGDPMKDQETVSWLSKHPALAGGLAELHEIYKLIMNEIDIKTYAEEIIKCLLERNGLPSTPEAICEMIINYVITEMGIPAFSAILYGNKKTRKIVQSEQFQGLLAEVTAENPEVLVNAAIISPGGTDGALVDPADLAAVSAATAAPAAIADGLIEAGAGVSEAAQNSPALGARELAYNAQQVERYVQGLKEFVDLRRLCEDLVKMGLDLPGKWLSGDFSLPDTGDILPSFPNPIVWKPISFWQPQGISHQFWRDVYEATIRVLTTQIAKAIKAVLDDFLKNCFTEDNEESPAYGGAKNLIPGFGPQGPAPREVFADYNMPTNQDRIREFLGRVADLLTARELCRLLQGKPSNIVLEAILELVEDSFPEYSRALSRKEDIRIFFADLGSRMDLTICEEFEAFMVVSDDFCDDLYSSAEKCERLALTGLPRGECENIIKEQLENDLNKLKGLAGLLQMDANEYLSDKIPPLDCSQGGLLPGIPPGLQMANNSIIDSIFDNVLISFYRELRGMSNLLKDLKTDDIANIAESAKAFETEKWVGMVTEGAKSGEIPFNTEWNDSQVEDEGFLKPINQGDLVGLLPLEEFPVAKLKDSVVDSDDWMDLFLLGQVKSKDSFDFDLNPPGFDADALKFEIPNTLPQGLLETFGGIVDLPKLTGAPGEDALSKFMKNNNLVTFSKYYNTLQNKENYYWHKKENTGENSHFFVIPRKDSDAAKLLGKYTKSFEFLSARNPDLATAISTITATLDTINNDNDLISIGGTGKSIKYTILQDVIENAQTGEQEPASSFSVKVLDNRRVTNYNPAKLNDNVVKSIDWKTKYTDEYKSTLSNMGLAFESSDKAFGKFMTKKIEDYIKQVYPDISLSDSIKQTSDNFFVDFAHPLMTQKILDNMMKINLQSPAFELRTFEKIFNKLFPGSEICWPENPDFNEGVLAATDLKADINKRLTDALCREFSKVGKGIGPDHDAYGNKKLRPIEKATITGLIIARIRIGIIQELFYFMPLIPIYDFKDLLLDDFFVEQTYDRITDSILVDQARLSDSDNYFDFILDQSQEMIKEALVSGHGKTQAHPSTPAPEGSVTHLHAYTIDDNGNGYAKEIVQGEHPAHVHLIKDYIVQFASGHSHLHHLEEKHRIPEPDESFKRLIKQEYSEVVDVVWNVFKSNRKKHAYVPRIRNYLDLFKWVGNTDKGYKTIDPSPITSTSATKAKSYPRMDGADDSVKFYNEDLEGLIGMPVHVVDKGVLYDMKDYWGNASAPEFNKLLTEAFNGAIDPESGKLATGDNGLNVAFDDTAQIWDHPGTFILEPYIWVDHKNSQDQSSTNLYDPNKNKPKFMDLLGEQGVTEQGQTVGYALNYVSETKETLHGFGVNDIETWSKIFNDFAEKSPDKNLKIDNYFENFCFGLRLVYQFPLYAANSTPLADPDAGPVKKTASGIAELFEVIQEDISEEADIGKVSWVNKTFLGAVVDDGFGNEYAFTKIPLADVKIPVWKFVKDLCKRPTKAKSSDLQFNNLKTGNDSSLENLFWQGADSAYSELLNNLYATDDFKFLFKHVFSYERMLLLNALYASYANTDIGELSNFTGTKAIILSFIRNMMNDVDHLSDNVPFVNNFGGPLGLSGMQDFTSTTGRFPLNPLEDQLKAIVKETPKLILKALAELTDPCVATGKSINEAIILVVESSLKVAEEIEKAAFEAVATVVDFNKGLVDGLYMIIKQIENTIPSLQAQIDMMPSTSAEQQAAKEVKKQELESLKQDLADKKQALVDGLTLLYGEYKGDVPDANGIILEEEFSKEDNEELYEKDWIKPPETKIYMAPKKDSKGETDTIEILPAAGSPSRLAWPGYQDSLGGSHELAQLDLNFKVAVRKTRNTMKAVDPYLLPIICFLLFPSSLPYGGGFIGFTPPPFGIGVGPPITPLGFIHLIMVSLGFGDSYDQWLNEEVDQIETDKGLSEEGEEC